MLQDLRRAIRGLRRNPAFSITALLVIALGIGATATMYAVARGVVLRPLPFDDPERLVFVGEMAPGGRPAPMAAANFRDLAAESRTFEDAALQHGANLVLTGVQVPLFVNGSHVSPSFFRVLRVRPALGRDFLPEEGGPGGSPAALLTYAFWERQFGADPQILGRPLTINGASVPVVGILPAAFQLGNSEIWIAGLDPGDPASRTNHFWGAIARLEPGVTVDRARGELDLAARRLAAAYPATNRGWTFRLQPLQDAWLGSYRQPLLILLAAVGLVLLLACANVANLLWQRAVTRRREVAIRSALGAGRLRIFRELMTESLLLALAGGVVGLLLARAMLHSVVALIPANTLAQVPGGGDAITLDRHVIIVIIGVSVLAALTAGLLPAARLARSTQFTGLTTRSDASGLHGRAWRQLFVISQVMLSTLLLAGAGLMSRSLSAMAGLDRGYRPDNVLAMYLVLPPSRYPQAGDRMAFVDGLLERVRAVPGVADAAGSDVISGRGLSYAAEGEPADRVDPAPSAAVRTATPEYFSTLGIPIVRGRAFAGTDRLGQPTVAVVNQALARAAWPEADPLGRRLRFLDPDGSADWLTVIGIAGDVKEAQDPRSPFQITARPTIYQPVAQRPGGAISLYVRTAVEPLTLLPAIRRQLAAVDKDIPPANVQTLRERIGASTATPRLHAALLSAFAALALVLAAIGLYGVIAYSVTRRLPEIGLRLALGADSGRLMRAVVLDALRLAIVGIGIGLAGTLLGGRFLASQLYGIAPHDPATLAGVSAVLVIVSAAASYLPARRAARVDPLIVLRSE